MLAKRNDIAYSYSHSFSATAAKSPDGVNRGRRKSKLTLAHGEYEDIASTIPDAGVRKRSGTALGMGGIRARPRQSRSRLCPRFVVGVKSHEEGGQDVEDISAHLERHL